MTAELYRKEVRKGVECSSGIPAEQVFTRLEGKIANKENQLARTIGS